MGLITKGQPDWDNKINEYVATSEKVYTWSNQSTNGFTLSAKRIGHTVNFVFAGLKNRQQVESWTKFLHVGFIPVGFRPVEEFFLIVEATPGLFSGKRLDWQKGLINILPDGSLDTRGIEIPADDPTITAGTYVVGKGTTATNDDYPSGN